MLLYLFMAAKSYWAGLPKRLTKSNTAIILVMLLPLT